MRLFAFLIMLCSLNPTAVGTPTHHSSFDEEMRQTVKHVEHIVQKIDIDQQEQQTQNILAHIEDMHTKGPNRLLWSAGGIGLYMRDFPELVTLAASLAADVFLYQNIKSARIAHIIEAIEQDLDGFYKAITTSLQQLGALEKEFNRRWWFSRAFTNKTARVLAINKPLVDYMNKHHAYIHRNPLKRDLIMPLALYVACDRVCGAIEQATTCPSLMPRGLQPTYYLDKDGAYVQTEHVPILLGAPLNALAHIRSYMSGKPAAITWQTAPLSLSGGAQLALFCVCPWRIFRGCGRNGNTAVFLVQCANKLLNNTIPPIFASPAAAFVYEFLGIIFAVQCFNEIHHDLWVREAIAQRPTLKKLVQAMIDARDADTDEHHYLQARAQLVKFIEEVHTDKAWYPGAFLRRWVQGLQGGASRLSKWPMRIVIGLCIYRAIDFFYPMIATSKPSQSTH